MTIRPMQPADVAATTALYQREMRGGGPAPAELGRWFERVALGSPWSDPEIPSLVAEEAGAITGVLVSHVRPLSIDDGPGRLACSGPLVVDREARGVATGAVLLRTYLDGPQDLTVTDGATELVRAMWERLGGELAHPQSIEWIKPLRPGSLGAAFWAGRRGREHPGPVGKTLGRFADLAAGLPPARRLLAASGHDGGAAAPVGLRSEPATGASLVAAIATVAERRRLRPAYDEAFADRLLAQLQAVSSRGELRARLVFAGGRSEPVGWFVYYLEADGVSQVISLAAADERGMDAVLDALLFDAREGGAAGLRGRLEPLIVAPAGRRGFLFRYSGQALVHAPNPATIALATSRHALLTRLEGEWWMDPHLL